MPRHERRLTPVDAINRAWTIPRNFRILRRFTQAVAADWYGVSERTWRRYELHGAPEPVLKRIAAYARGAGGDTLHLLT